MKSYPIFLKRKTHDLNRIWDFRFLDEYPEDIASVKYDDRLPVPSAFDAFPRYAGKRGVGIYRTFVDISPGISSLLKIGGAGMICKVYIDNEQAASHIGTYTPFEVQIPASCKVRREITILTDNRYDYEECPLHENFFDFYNYGGIIRQVYLEEVPENPIRNVHVVTKDITAGEINVNVDFYGNAVPLTYSIDGSDSIKAESPEFSAFVPNPSEWSPESPNLHTITVDSGSDSITVRFGLRMVKTEKGKIFVNDKAVKLLGYCRHESHPQFGSATPEIIMVSDLQLMKEMGCNFIRGSHYQQDSRFLDLCDEMGFFVFSESLGWGQGEKQFTDGNFIQAQLEQTKAMIESDFNHPSIVMWGFLNEGASNEEYARNCYSRLIKSIRSLDPSRPVTYASNRCLKDVMLEEADIVCFNFYPGWYSANPDDEYPVHESVPKIHEMIEGLEKRRLEEKPFIISEIGAGAIYGWHDSHNGYWAEEYQSELLSTVCREVVSNERISGVSLWQFCDCRTYQGSRSLMRPRAFNNKGTFDEYRRPKEAYKKVKDIFTSFCNTHTKGK